MASSIALIVLCALVLILLLLVIFMRNDLGAMKDLCERMRDKWASTENLCRKLDVAVMWLIEEKGVTLEQASYWSNSWYITPLKNKYRSEFEKSIELDKQYSEMLKHREAIVQALADGIKRGLDEHDEGKGKKK